MTDDRFLLADFVGRRNWPTLSFVWHPLNNDLVQHGLSIQCRYVEWHARVCLSTVRPSISVLLFGLTVEHFCWSVLCILTWPNHLTIGLILGYTRSKITNWGPEAQLSSIASNKMFAPGGPSSLYMTVPLWAWWHGPSLCKLPIGLDALDAPDAYYQHPWTRGRRLYKPRFASYN